MIKDHPKSVVVKESTEACIECSADGIDSIYYQWEKYMPSNDSWIMPLNAVNITSPKLIFSEVTEEDEGIYHCIAFK